MDPPDDVINDGAATAVLIPPPQPKRIRLNDSSFLSSNPSSSLPPSIPVSTSISKEDKNS